MKSIVSFLANALNHPKTAQADDYAKIDRRECSIIGGLSWFLL